MSGLKFNSSGSQRKPSLPFKAPAQKSFAAETIPVDDVPLIPVSQAQELPPTPPIMDLSVSASDNSEEQSPDHSADDEIDDKIDLIIREEVKAFIAEYGDKIFKMTVHQWLVKRQKEKEKRKADKKKLEDEPPKKKRKIN